MRSRTGRLKLAQNIRARRLVVWHGSGSSAPQRRYHRNQVVNEPQHDGLGRSPKVIKGEQALHVRERLSLRSHAVRA